MEKVNPTQPLVDDNAFDVCRKDNGRFCATQLNDPADIKKHASKFLQPGWEIG